MLIYAACLSLWALTVSPILTVLIYYFRMYGTFANSELAGGLPHGGAAFNDVIAQLQHTLADIVLQFRAPPSQAYTPCIWDPGRKYAACCCARRCSGSAASCSSGCHIFKELQPGALQQLRQCLRAGSKKQGQPLCQVDLALCVTGWRRVLPGIVRHFQV